MKSWVFGSFQLLLLAVVLLRGLAEVSNSLASVCAAAWGSPKGLLDAQRGSWMPQGSSLHREGDNCFCSGTSLVCFVGDYGWIFSSISSRGSACQRLGFILDFRLSRKIRDNKHYEVTFCHEKLFADFFHHLQKARESCTWKDTSGCPT